MASPGSNFDTFGGLALMAVGGILLADEFLNINMTGSFWPLALVGFGLYLLLGRKHRPKGGAK